MAKKVTARQQTGRTGEVFVGYRFQSMGQIWHESRSDAGIDRHVEIRDIATGEATNRHIGVQIKSYSGQFHGENEKTFDYYCSEDDLEYWLRGTMPVILVCCRPTTQEAYWVDIRKEFAGPQSRATRKVVFDKSRTILDESALPALQEIALPEELGLYLGLPPKPERLFSNLLRVTSTPERIYVADTSFFKRKQVFAFLKEKDLSPQTAEFITRDNKICSANDLRAPPWKLVVDVGTIESFTFQEWLAQDEKHHHYALELLNHCLRSFLFSKSVRWNEKDEVFFFKAAKGQKSMRVKTKGLRREETAHTVVKSYYRKNSLDISYVRHHAIKANFLEIGGDWFLQITPTYRFTRDGLGRLAPPKGRTPCEPMAAAILAPAELPHKE